MKLNIFIPNRFNLQVVMKMETLSRDSLYLKQRLNLNIDVEFVRQGGKEGHTTADRWKLILVKVHIRVQCTQYM